MSKESIEFPNPAEKKITFDGETICALGRAFKKNSEAAEELAGVVGKEKMKILPTYWKIPTRWKLSTTPPKS